MRKRTSKQIFAETLLDISGRKSIDKITVQQTRYKAYTGFTGMEDMGICTATGEENKSEAKMAEIKAFASKL